jgi:hypothetical protein
MSIVLYRLKSIAMTLRYRLLAIILIIISGLATHARAQTTAEDSLNSGAITRPSTVISGYGEAHYQRDLRYDTAQADLARAVIFVGHTFNSDISFFSELEIEDAKVEGGTSGGEVAYEQAYLRFNLDRENYITAGLFVPRIGIVNENHLPTTFNGVDRPFVETLIIPATWRELGVGLWGKIDALPGLNYSLALLNGLNSADFEYGTGIQGGRSEARLAPAANLAVTGSLQYYLGDARFQISSYYGGTAGLSAHQADSLQLNSGPFGTPVFLNEGDIMYYPGPFSFRALATRVDIPDAYAINRAYANNTPSAMVGGYLELGCNLLRIFNAHTEKELSLFGRFEYLDLNYSVPSNGVPNDLLIQRYVVAGLTYKPITEVVIKADYTFRSTGMPNPALQFNPFPQAQTYQPQNGFLNLGLGYSF